MQETKKRSYKGKRRSSRPMRLPNGFGSVVYLGSGRRHPYAAKTATKSYDLNGYPRREVIGYFETWDDAYQALVEYNKSPYDISQRNATFAEVYQMLVNRKFNNPAKKLSKSSKNALAAAYKKCSPLHDRPFIQIKTQDMQALLDDLIPKYSHASLEHVKTLWTQMFKLAMEYDIVEKNYASFVTINKEDDDEHGVPFTRAQVDELWSKVDEVLWVDEVLVMIYSGFRISAYETLKVDLDNLTFQGGVKTAAGKDRIVPIHNRIVPLVKRLLDEKRLFGVNNKEIRLEFMDAIEVALGSTGGHTPHDCRHTLATMLDNAGAPDKITKAILGHSLGQDVTNKIYIHKDVEQLREAINLIP